MGNDLFVFHPTRITGIRVLDALIGSGISLLFLLCYSLPLSVMSGTVLCVWDHLRAVTAAVRADIFNETTKVEL